MLIPKSKDVFPADGAGAATNIQGIVALSETKASDSSKDHDSSNGKTLDCDAGYNNWVKGWSTKKIEWCCANKNRGCYEANSGFYPALIVQNFTKKDDDKHKHTLEVITGDVVFTHENHPSDKWTYVYTRWFTDSPHGWVPHWAVNANTTAIVREFGHNKSSDDHKDCIPVLAGEQVFVQHKHESGWTWVVKVMFDDGKFKKVEGWVPDWALPKGSEEDNSKEKEEDDSKQKEEDDNKKKEEDNSKKKDE